MDLQKSFKIINKNNKKFPGVHGGSNYFYNCYGFVAYVKDWIESEDWLYPEEIESLLNKNTVPISNDEDEINVGDIVSYYNDSRGIVHTAILVGISEKNPMDSIVINKMGSGELKVCSLQHSYNSYNCDKIVFHREKEI